MYGARYYGNGLCYDFAPYVGHLGRDLTLLQNALSPFYHGATDVGGLTKLTIGNQVTSIPAEAFLNNRNLTTATIGNGLKAIPQNAFANCVKLTGISIPGNVESIGRGAFQNDSAMTTLALGEGLKAIDFDAFLRCSRVKSITLPASLDSISSSAFTVMSGVTSFTIADSERPLKVYGARYYGNGLCYDFALNDAYVGRDFTLAQNAYSPFYSHQQLADLTIGSMVTRLIEYQFYNCRKLTNVTANAVEPPVCAANSFASVNTLVIPLTVPAASKSKYMEALVWKDFFFESDFIPGDVNGDGQVNAGDVSSVYEAILAGIYTEEADVNNDGQVNAGDVSALYSIILGQ